MRLTMELRDGWFPANFESKIFLVLSLELSYPSDSGEFA